MISLKINEPSCRICDADKVHQSVRASSVYGGRPEHDFWHCSQCDAIYLYPVPSEKEEVRFYRGEFEKFMVSRSGPERDWGNTEAHIKSNQDQVIRRMPFIKPYIHPGMDLLEIGCSSGFMLKAFQDLGLDCVGIEPSGVFSNYLCSKGFKVYKSLEGLQKKSKKKFDLIVHFFVLEHVRSPYEFFSQSMEVLKEGGKIIAEVPCANDPLANLYSITAFEKFYWSIAHHYYYTPKSLGYVLDKMGLQYQMIAEQRYDLSNHIVWMTEGKPGGQGRYNHIYSAELIEKYKDDLKKNWVCDTIFLYINK